MSNGQTGCKQMKEEQKACVKNPRITAKKNMKYGLCLSSSHLPSKRENYVCYSCSIIHARPPCNPALLSYLAPLISEEHLSYRNIYYNLQTRINSRILAVDNWKTSLSMERPGLLNSIHSAHVDISTTPQNPKYLIYKHQTERIKDIIKIENTYSILWFKLILYI